MIKKSLIAIALVTMVACMAQAGGLKRYDWPCTFNTLDINDVPIPVFMDIGLTIDIVNQNDLKKKGITLKQTGWQLYEGEVKIQIKCNFDLTLGAKLILNDNGKLMNPKLSGMGEVSRAWIVDPFVPKTLCLTTAERILKVKLLECKTEHLEVKKGVQVATVILTVKPEMPCLWVDP